MRDVCDCLRHHDRPALDRHGEIVRCNCDARVVGIGRDYRVYVIAEVGVVARRRAESGRSNAEEVCGLRRRLNCDSGVYAAKRAQRIRRKGRRRRRIPDHVNCGGGLGGEGNGGCCARDLKRKACRVVGVRDSVPGCYRIHEGNGVSRHFGVVAAGCSEGGLGVGDAGRQGGIARDRDCPRRVAVRGAHRECREGDSGGLWQWVEVARVEGEARRGRD